MVQLQQIETILGSCPKGSQPDERFSFVGSFLCEDAPPAVTTADCPSH